MYDNIKNSVRSSLLYFSKIGIYRTFFVMDSLNTIWDRMFFNHFLFSHKTWLLNFVLLAYDKYNLLQELSFSPDHDCVNTRKTFYNRFLL